MAASRSLAAPIPFAFLGVDTLPPLALGFARMALALDGTFVYAFPAREPAPAAATRPAVLVLVLVPGPRSPPTLFLVRGLVPLAFAPACLVLAFPDMPQRSVCRRSATTPAELSQWRFAFGER